jgi:AcrR family transcriptional regulator
MPTKKRAYHHGDLRRTLLQASVALILEKGLDELSLREVARRAGVSPAAPYHHFATRQELLAALALDGFGMLTERMRAARDAASAVPRERLCAIGEAYIRFAVEHPAHFRLMFRHSLVPFEALPADGASRDAFVVLLDAVSEVLADENVAQHVERRGLVLLAWSAVHGAAELVLDGPLANGIDELDVASGEVPRLVTRAFVGLLGAPQRPQAKGSARTKRPPLGR